MENCNLTTETGDRILLRKATESDIPFLLTLREKTMEKYLRENHVPCSKADNLRRIRYRFEDALIVEMDQIKAGLFKVAFLQEEAQWYLFQIQIHPDYQNLKIGSCLLRSLLKKANQQHLPVGLSVLKTNPAMKLYKRFGFIATSENEHEYQMLKSV